MEPIRFKFNHQLAFFDRQKAWKTCKVVVFLLQFLSWPILGGFPLQNRKFGYSHQVVMYIYHRYKASRWMDKSHWPPGMPENKRLLQSLFKCFIQEQMDTWDESSGLREGHKFKEICQKPQASSFFFFWCSSLISTSSKCDHSMTARGGCWHPRAKMLSEAGGSRLIQ